MSTWDGHTWDVHVYDRRTSRTTTHVMRFERKTDRSDQAWVNVQGAKKYKAPVGYVLSVPHLGETAAAKECACSKDAVEEAPKQRTPYEDALVTDPEMLPKKLSAKYVRELKPAGPVTVTHSVTTMPRGWTYGNYTTLDVGSRKVEININVAKPTRDERGEASGLVKVDGMVIDTQRADEPKVLVERLIGGALSWLGVAREGAAETASVAHDFPTVDAAATHALGMPNGRSMYVYFAQGKFHLANPGDEPVGATPVSVVAGYGAAETASVAREGRTYAKSHNEILDYLASRAWDVKKNLKVPHATSPDGRVRLWFKTQAVYFTNGTHHELGNARSLFADTRAMTPEQFLRDVQKFVGLDPTYAAETASVAHESAAAEGQCLPWVKIEKDPKRFGACMAGSRKLGPVKNAAAVYKLIGPILEKEDQEVFLVLLCDVRGNLRGVTEVARGQRSRVAVGIDDIVRVVTASGAEMFIIAHCHPTGKATPSAADKSLTQAILKAFEPMGNILLADHVIVGNGEYYSFTDDKVYKA